MRSREIDRQRIGWFNAPMIRTALFYGLALAAIAFFLDWLDYRHVMRAHSTEFYVLCVALIFAGLGLWLGRLLTPQRRAASFERNEAAIRSLGISAREYEVLELVAEGHSNKAIARALAISPNTVKSHMARLFEKLESQTRTGATRKARELEILP